MEKEQRFIFIPRKRTELQQGENYSNKYVVSEMIKALKGNVQKKETKEGKELHKSDKLLVYSISVCETK
jgi:hypothetical protein